MAHLKNITHFFVINYCFEDTQMLKSDLNLDIRLGLVLNDSSFNCCCRRGRIIFLMAVAANRSNMTWHFLSDVFLQNFRFQLSDHRSRNRTWRATGSPSPTTTAWPSQTAMHFSPDKEAKHLQCRGTQ